MSLKILSTMVGEIGGMSEAILASLCKWIYNLSIFMVTFMILWIKILNY